MELHDTVPQEADDREDALEVPSEPGVAERTDNQEDAPEEPPADRDDPISPREDESSGVDKGIIQRPPYYDCQDAGCTWPCAHHLHTNKGPLNFYWYPDLEHFDNEHPEIPRFQSEMKVGMKDCQFCRIFFTIAQSDCPCGANAQNDHILESGGGCRFRYALCRFRSNWRLSYVDMQWTCSAATHELGLATGKVVWSPYDLANESFLTRPYSVDAPVFPYIQPCTGDLLCNPGSNESLALMKGWIDDCQRSHQVCKTPQQVGGPKRLLQCLSKSDGVRLVETRSLPQRCDYIALSYCWGDGTAVKKTKKATEAEHQSGIPDEDLPLLYQDAVALAREFGIGYLWIDSLCIIQDSKEDKEEEIAQMSEIFRGALVVVVAAGAESPLESLLRIRPQAGQRHTWRTASLIRYNEIDLDVKFRERTDLAHLNGDATRDTFTGKRAWCFQEKLLASRCLVFGGDEVVWECRSCCLCECGIQQDLSVAPGNAPISSPWVVPYRQMLLPFAEHEPFQPDGTLKYFADAEAAYSFWETAVRKYSAGALSFQTDRLPAISAVASVVGEATGDRYLAGLWKDDLLFGLAWFSGGSLEDDPSPHHRYIAPTWSWASLPSRVCYPPRSNWTGDANLDAPVFDDARSWTALEGPNPYGAVRSDAAIVLSGFHCNAELTIPERGFNAQLDFGHGDVQTVNLDTASLGITRVFHALDFMRVEPGTTNADRHHGNARYLRRAADRQSDRQAACSGIVRLLWLREGEALILTPSRRKAGAYERLGILIRWLNGLGKIPKKVQRSSIELV